MKDRLERFVEENRNDFEESFDARNSWDKIQGKINQSPAKPRFNWYAAASVILLVAVGWLVIDRIDLNNQVTALEKIAVEGRSYAEIESYYTQQISLKSEQVSKQSEGLDYPLESDIQTLQENYESLKKQLKKQGANEKLINAMIQNLRTQIDLLNEQLSIIEHINDYMKNENQKSNETQI